MITMTYGIFFHPMLFSWQRTLSCLLVKRGVEQLQRSNVGHAQRDQFLPAACQFPAQNLKGSIRKQPLSREGCVKKLKFSSEICKRKKEYRKKKAIYIRVFLDLPFCFELYQKSSMVFKHWLVWLFITFVRQLVSDSMKACHLAIMTFAHAQTFVRGMVENDPEM